MSRMRTTQNPKGNGKMHHITAKSSSTEVQNAAGHDRTAWRRFLRITAEEGQHIVTKYGLKGSWRDFENNLQRELRLRVNERLSREDIPQVTEKIIDWRMAQVMKDRKATKANPPRAPSVPDSASSNASLSQEFSLSPRSSRTSLATGAVAPPMSRNPSSVHSSPGLAHVDLGARSQLPLPGGFQAVNAPPPMPIKMVTFPAASSASPSPPLPQSYVHQHLTPRMMPAQPPAATTPPTPPASHSRTPSDQRGTRFDPIRGWVAA